MADSRDRIFRIEELTLYAIILGFVGLATAFLAFGLSQLKIFEAWQPHIFIFLGVVYLALSLFFITSMKRTLGADRQSTYRGESHGTGNFGKFKDSIGAIIAGFFGKTKFFLHYLLKYKVPLAFGLASGVFVTIIATASVQNFQLPAFNLQFPNMQSSASNASLPSLGLVKSEENKAPANVVDFSASKAGVNYSFSFSLVDKDAVKVNSSGNATLKVFDKSNKLLYEESFEIFETDFPSLVYTKAVDESKVGKSISSSGNATIKFVTSSGGELSNSTGVEVPILTLSEIEKMYEDDYTNAATNVDKTVTKYSFDATVVKIGYFTKAEGSNTNIYFRVDLRVKNIYAVENEFKTSTAKLTIGGTTYSPDPQSPFKTGNIKGGEIKQNYLLFKDVPSTISGGITIRAGTANSGPPLNEEYEYILNV
ncbi:MAG: hypothetical protein HY361_05340 [Candidatus Aenigmarchaeota archaeon]|nr:hypothetical protein [Candidatus Aenigmarchaeota archaeon]